MLLTIGSDPEFLIKSPAGKLISAIGIVAGSKEKPHPVKYGHIHPDNVLLEINPKPARCRSEFVLATHQLVKEAVELMHEQGLDLSNQCLGNYAQDQLEHPSAVEAGCDPDYNAYEGGQKNPLPCYRVTPQRAAGGHIHIGCDMEQLPDQMLYKLIRTLDLTVTLPMLCREREGRRKYYGKAGSFRKTKHGFEYRTPSNVWTFSKTRIAWTYDQVLLAMKHYASVPDDPAIRLAIDTHDVRKADEIMKGYNLTPLPGTTAVSPSAC